MQRPAGLEPGPCLPAPGWIPLAGPEPEAAPCQCLMAAAPHHVTKQPAGFAKHADASPGAS